MVQMNPEPIRQQMLISENKTVGKDFLIGHGIEVSAKHYLHVPEELYDKVATTKETQTATKIKR